MNDKIKKIREKCIEANPEIVEKCWKCEGTGYLQNSLERIEGFVGSNVCRESFCKDGIISRPIRLADVLLTLEDEWRTKYGEGVKNRMSEGVLLYLLVSKWNLHDDNLENQSPETIDFLFELLTPSNKESTV